MSNSSNDFLDAVTRVTVVGEHGVEFERYDVYAKGCSISIQDEGKTLKIFPKSFPLPVSAPRTLADMTDEERQQCRGMRVKAQGEVTDVINPDYYKRNGLEAIDAIEAFFMHSPHLANAFKYMVRMGNKPGNSLEQDAEKAKWYIDRWVEFKSRGEPLNSERGD